MKVSRVMICGSLWLTVMTTTMMTMMLSGTPVAMAAPRTTAASSKAAVPKVHKNNKNNKKAAEAIVQVKVEAPAPAVPAWKADLLHRAKVGFYFGLWYALNIVYNILNKKLLNVWAAPMTVGTIQLGVGALYAGMMWTLGLRATPSVSLPAVQMTLKRVGLWHGIGQLCSMISLGAGPVSFTHIVKALEPFFSAMVSGVLLGQWMPLPVYLTLIPVVGGVGYACLKERSFSWLAFSMAMLSNVAFALRAVLSKTAMTAAKSPDAATLVSNLTAPNVFGLVTVASFFLSIPLAILGEGNSVAETLSTALEQQSASLLARSVFVSGLFHYLNNEVMYLALGSVHPITLAVGNTMKRVFILVASVMVFRNVISTQAAIGSAIGMSGVLLYSLTKQYYEKKAATEAAALAAAAAAAPQPKKRR